MRVVVGWCGADTHELLGTDFDHRDAQVILEMGDDVFRHGKPFNAATRRRGKILTHHSETAARCLAQSYWSNICAYNGTSDLASPQGAPQRHHIEPFASGAGAQLEIMHDQFQVRRRRDRLSR